MDLVRREVHSLSPSAATLWSAIREGTTEDELLRLLCERFEVDATRARRDIVAFVAALETQGLVTVELVEAR